MLIGYAMPAVTNVSLSSGNWLASDGWAALVDGRPSRAARIQRAGSVTLTAALASGMVPGIVALLGLNVSPGTAVSAAGANGVAQALPDGTVCAYLLPPAGAAVSAVSVTVGGSGMLEIGELVVMPAIDTPIEPGWETEVVDPSESIRDRGSQLGTSRRVPYRRVHATMQAQGAGVARQWEAARMALTRDRRAVVIPRHADAASVHATAVYGAVRIGSIRHLGGDWYGASIVADEVPAHP